MSDRRKAAEQGPPRTIAGTFWLREPLGPATAWDLLAILRSGGVTFTPAWFRADPMRTPRKLGRRNAALAVEALAHGRGVELLRRAGALPRGILRSPSEGGGRVIHLGAPCLTSLAEALAFINVVRELCALLRPTSGMVDEIDRPATAQQKSQTHVPVGGGEDCLPQSVLPSDPQGFFPAWLTILDGERVITAGASRLLMAPVFLIEPLLDGGLLIAATPLPRNRCARAGRRSPARTPDFRAAGGWPGTPLQLPEGAPVPT